MWTQPLRRLQRAGDKAEQAFQNVIHSLFNMQDPLAQNTVGVALFGTMWEDLGVEGVKALTNLNGGISTAKDALAQINEIKYDDFGSAISGLGRILQTSFVLPIGEQVLPILSEFATELTAGAVAAKGDITLMAASFSTAFAGLAINLADSLPKLTSAMSEIALGIINGIVSVLPQLTTVATDIILTLLNGIITAVPQLAQAANQIILALLNGIITALPLIIDGALQLVLALANGIGQALPQLVPKSCGNGRND